MIVFIVLFNVLVAGWRIYQGGIDDTPFSCFTDSLGSARSADFKNKN